MPQPARSSASRAQTPSRPARASRQTRPTPKDAPRRTAQVRPDDVARRWWLLPLIVVTVLAVFAAAYYPVVRVQYRETRERARLQAELSAIRARNDRLRTEVARLKTPEGVEDYARVQLGMVKKGENVYVVVDGTEPSQSVLAQGVPHIDSQEAVVPQTGPWTAFLDAIFGVQ